MGKYKKIKIVCQLKEITRYAEGAGVMFEPESAKDTFGLFKAGGWTLLTAVNLMLFSLLHNPCSTTIYTIYKETKSAKWTAVSALLPLVMYTHNH